MKTKNEYYDFGYNYFGPFLFGFAKWLYENLNGIEKVFFLSRDGYMMIKAFDYIADNSIESKYVYFSRKSIRQALLWRTNSYLDSLKYLSNQRFISFGTILEYYGFDEKKRRDIAEFYKIPLEKDFIFSNLKTNNVLNQIYDDL